MGLTVFFLLLGAASFTNAETLRVVSNIELASYSGRYTNVKIGQDGLPFVAFNDEKTGGVLGVHCSDVLCTNSTKVAIDSSGNADNARFIFMRMSPSTGFPLLSYSEQTKDPLLSSLKFVACNDVACSNYTVTKIAKGGLLSQPAYSFFTFADNDIPLITFFDENVGLKYIQCKNSHCSTFHESLTIASGISTGKYPSVQYVGTGLFFSYYEAESKRYAYSSCKTIACERGDITHGNIASDSGKDLGKYSYTIQNRVGISTMFLENKSGDLYYANCSVPGVGGDLPCSSVVVDNIGADAYGVFPEMDLYYGFSEFPMFSYFNSTSDSEGALKIALCTSLDCTQPSIQTLASGTAGYGRDSSIAYLKQSSQTDAGPLLYVSYLFYNGGDDKKAMLMILQA